MHSRPLREPDGAFGPWNSTKENIPGFRCRECGSINVRYRFWESSCGGHEDKQYECLDCRRKWWVEGPDA